MDFAPLDLAADPVELTAALVDVPSVSGQEAALADLVEVALRGLPYLTVERDGDPAGSTRRLVVEILPRALTLCVPARAEGSEQEDNP